MRVTAETKAATQQKILAAARRLFAERGFEATTTRDIAREAEIAAGTLFNYFPTKEAIVACLVRAALQEGGAQAAAPPGDSLESDLFALVAGGLRALKPFRKELPSLLETALSPAVNAPSADAAALRTAHLEAVTQRIVQHGLAPPSAAALQLYWMLYTGVLLFWAHDASRKQEDTLALLDHSLHMFVGWLRDHADPPPTSRSD